MVNEGREGHGGGGGGGYIGWTGYGVGGGVERRGIYSGIELRLGNSESAGVLRQNDDE